MKKIFTLLTLMVAFAFSSQAAYYLVGNAPFGNGWDPSSGVEMTQNSDGTYSFKGTVNYSLWDDKLTIKSVLDLFTPYNETFGNVDVNWDVLVGLNVTSLLTVTFQSTLKYDDDIKFIDANGEHGARVQFKEILGVGLSYKF